MVDTENRIFREHRLCNAIEFPRGGQVATERLLDDHARMFGQARAAQPFDYGCKKRGWDGEVVRRSPRIVQRLLERFERTQGFVIAMHVREPRVKMIEGATVIDAARSLDAVLHAFAQLREIPFRG